MRIGELANLAGVSSRTIDYYTQIGLIHEVRRSPGKHRLYSQDALKSIQIIKDLQKHHYTLEEISCLFRQHSEEDNSFKLISQSAHYNSPFFLKKLYMETKAGMLL